MPQRQSDGADQMVKGGGGRAPLHAPGEGRSEGRGEVTRLFQSRLDV